MESTPCEERRLGEKTPEKNSFGNIIKLCVREWGIHPRGGAGRDRRSMGVRGGASSVGVLDEGDLWDNVGGILELLHIPLRPQM